MQLLGVTAQTLSCCVVPFNMVLIKSHMRRGERILFGLFKWQCYTYIWSQHGHIKAQSTENDSKVCAVVSIFMMHNVVLKTSCLSAFSQTDEKILPITQEHFNIHTFQNKTTCKISFKCLNTNLWFSSLSAGVMVFFCFRCSITAFCFITTWNTRCSKRWEQTMFQTTAWGLNFKTHSFNFYQDSDYTKLKRMAVWSKSSC